MMKFDEKPIAEVGRFDIFYYSISLIYVVWIVISFFTPYWLYSMLLITGPLSKFLILGLRNSKVNSIHDVLFSITRLGLFILILCTYLGGPQLLL